MPYQSELSFLRAILTKCRLQILVLDLAEEPDRRIDLGLRETLGWEKDYESSFYELFRRCEDNVVYRGTDQFRCSYMYCRLPGGSAQKMLVIGPYLREALNREQLLEEMGKAGVLAGRLPQAEGYYGSIPVLEDGNAAFAAIEAFADIIWGGADAYGFTDINQELYAAPPHQLGREDEQSRPEETTWVMKALEQRYAMENEMMRAVSLGLTHKAEQMFKGFSSNSLEQRLSDPVRNIKNYCIVMNTLLRKAAESGGVHPLYLDRLSSAFARKVETLLDADEVLKLMEEMFREYCRLVDKHTTRKYSSPVQKAVIQIDMDLSGDLSLKKLAQVQGLNASYLSALFRKETGHTVTEYVNQKRLRTAMRLLGTTELQVQTVALRCGIADVNYFSKLFKKYTGRTPKEYRQMLKTQRPAGENS